VTVAELLKRRVVTEDGRNLGRVYDLRLHIRDGRARIVALAVGRRGAAKRLDGNVERNETPEGYVAWERIVRVEPGRVVVRA
jgi:sporulation protein YlmC with PRC-barrel domain